jgi:hypothetical protein
MMSYRTDDDVVEVFDGSAYVGVGGAGGLTLISSTAMSGANVSVDNCFSATYTNYRILFNYLPSAGNFVTRLRYRVGGADDTANVNYFNNVALTETGGNYSSINNGNPATSLTVNEILNTRYSAMSLDVRNPFLAIPTIHTGFGTYDRRGFQTYGINEQNVSFTGFTLINSGGTFTSGNIKVYGYED